MEFNITPTKFTQDQLVFLDKEKVRTHMLGLPFKDKIFQVRLREGWILKNEEQINDLKKSNHPSSTQLIEKFSTINENLFIEVEKFRYSAFIENQPTIYSSTDFQKRNEEEKRKFEEEKAEILQLAQVGIEETGFGVWDTLNDIITSDPEMFTTFAVEAMKKSSTDSVVPYLKEIAKAHDLRLSKNPIKK